MALAIKRPVRSSRTEGRDIVPGRVTLVDADLLCYITRDADEPLENVLHSVKLVLQQIQSDTKCEHLWTVLSSSTNYRYEIFPEYKANRKDLEKPPHYQAIKDYLIKHWDAKVAPDGWEADDFIAKGMFGYNELIKKGKITDPDNTVIASLDKDFFTVPCNLYRWRGHNAGNVFKVTEDDAKAFLAHQLLTGDAADGIKSPVRPYKKDMSFSKSGYGHAKARDFLLDYSYDQMIDAVETLYIEQGFTKEFGVNMKLLEIGRYV